MYRHFGIVVLDKRESIPHSPNVDSQHALLYQPNPGSSLVIGKPFLLMSLLTLFDDPVLQIPLNIYVVLF
jgi:hypothetical protein